MMPPVIASFHSLRPPVPPPYVFVSSTPFSSLSVTPALISIYRLLRSTTPFAVRARGELCVVSRSHVYIPPLFPTAHSAHFSLTSIGTDQAWGKGTTVRVLVLRLNPNLLINHPLYRGGILEPFLTAADDRGGGEGWYNTSLTAGGGKIILERKVFLFSYQRKYGIWYRFVVLGLASCFSLAGTPSSKQK